MPENKYTFNVIITTLELTKDEINYIKKVGIRRTYRTVQSSLIVQKLAEDGVLYIHSETGQILLTNHLGKQIFERL